MKLKTWFKIFNFTYLWHETKHIHSVLKWDCCREIAHWSGVAIESFSEMEMKVEIEEQRIWERGNSCETWYLLLWKRIFTWDTRAHSWALCTPWKISTFSLLRRNNFFCGFNKMGILFNWTYWILLDVKSKTLNCCKRIDIIQLTTLRIRINISENFKVFSYLGYFQ